MPYKFIPDRMYRMPTHFGPSAGPREGEAGRRFENIDAPKITDVIIKYLTNREQLEDLLPDGFPLEVGTEPIVTIGFGHMTEIPWLAGHGYNYLNVTFPVFFNGEKDRVAGRFMAVLWVGIPDSILTGREELGYPKLYCELPDPQFYNNGVHCTANWMGFKFADMKLKNLEKIPLEDYVGAPVGEGTINHKYIPKTGEWGTAEVSYICITPYSVKQKRTVEVWKGEGKVEFQQATWEDMPSQFHIVNGLKELEVREYLGAMVIKTVGSGDLRNTYILK